MCNVVQGAADTLPVQDLDWGRIYKVGKEGCVAIQTRVGDVALVCRHNGGKWELTPELKPGEILQVPEGSELEVVNYATWKEVNGTNTTAV